ncbi:hypothetical protein TEA_029891 [Camellia sinensis var. sinensis]|uniref:BTB domain-containing protein n=1 Tax=Camellia sinensis var. sinensis TaxID=542762 RepID=A0A4S4EIL4_CAMSN|nr:hypothetical protein TEA_029891 [Camellia sinensis var. sinensis]
MGFFGMMFESCLFTFFGFCLSEGSGSKAESMVKSSEELGVVTVGELKPSISGKRSFRPSSSTRHVTEWPISDVSSDLTIEVGTTSFALHKASCWSGSNQDRNMRSPFESLYIQPSFESVSCSEELGVVTVGELKPSIAGKRSFRPSSSTRHVTEWPISDVSSDLTIEVGTASFALHKFPLVSRSGRIRKLLLEAKDSIVSHINLSAVPGGPKAFELAAKFCYGVNTEITLSNVAMLHCSEELGVVTVGELKPSIAGKRSFRPSSSTRHVTEWPISDVSSDLTIEVGTASFALHKDSFAVPSSFSEWKNTKTVVGSKRFNSIAYKSVNCTGWTRGI